MNYKQPRSYMLIRKYSGKNLAFKELSISQSSGELYWDRFSNRICFVSDSMISIIDTNLTILKKSMSIRPGGYGRAAVLSNSHILAFTDNFAFEYDTNLTLVKQYELPSNFRTLFIQTSSTGSVYATVVANNTIGLYKLTIEDLITHEDSGGHPLSWAATDQGFRISAEDFEKAELWNLSGQKETHYTTEIQTSMKGMLLMRVYGKGGVPRTLKALR